MNALQNFLQTQLRHALTAAAGVGAFLLSKDLIPADQVGAVNDGVAQMVSGLFAVGGAFLARGVMLLVARFPILSFLGHGGVNVIGSKGSDESSGSALSLLLLCTVGAGLAVQALTGCQALSDVRVGKARIYTSNEDNSAKGGLTFEDGEVGLFGRGTTEDGRTVEFEIVPTIGAAVEPAK